MIKVAVCDDELDWREKTAKLIREYFDKYSEIPMRINTFETGQALIEDVEFNGFYDIYVLDVIMPELNGVQLAERLRMKKDNGIIIFLTTSKEYAVDSYMVDAFHYLLKPIKKEYLYDALKKAAEKLLKRRTKAISVKKKCDTKLVSFDEIYYVELVRKCLCFHVVNGENVTSTSQRISFMEAIAPLFTDERFAPCGASFAINLFYVKSVEKNMIVFSDGTRLSVPKNACVTLREKWFNYWFRES